MSEVRVSGARTVEGTSGGDPNYLSFVITLTEAATENVTVRYRLWSATAQAGSDVYDYFTGESVTFAPGETSKTVNWRIDADSLVETDEAVEMEVFGVVGGGVVMAGGATVLRATGWVLDDDGTANKLALFTSNPLVVEGDAGTRNAVFELSLSRPPTSPITIGYATVDGSARAGQDYTSTAGSLTFAVGQTTASVAVPVLGNTVSEPSDAFTLAVTAPSSVSLVTSGEATILDDDAGTVVVSVAGASNNESTSGGDPNYLSFAITLSQAATANVTVQYRLWSGTAQAGSDVYDYFSGESVTFAPGETSKTVSFRIDADALVETDEAVVLEVYSARGGDAVLAGNASVLRATGWVLDDDGTANKLALFTSEPLVVEGNTGTRQANFEVSLSRPAPEAFSVQYTTVDGSARAGQDYTATSGTLNFVKGQTTASVSVPVLGDTTSEPSDSFTLSFTTPSLIAHTSLGEATILDDDASAVVVSVAGASNNESTSGGDPNYLSFAITLSQAATSNVTVGYRLLSGTASAGSDVYDYFSGASVTFAPGETSRTVNWRIDGDAEVEADEAVVLEVFNVSGSAALAGNATVLRATGWVLDDDGTGNKLALYSSRPVMVEGDSGTRQANFEISLSRPAPEAFSVQYATVDGSARAGEDYVATSGTLSFVKGQTSASVSVDVVGDTVPEPGDYFALSFETPTLIAATSIGEALILDDDAGTPVVSVTGGANFEGTGSDPNYLLFGITLSEAATGPVTVGYRLLSGTATAGTDVYDYFTGESVTFAAGETSKTVAWRIDGDAEAEADEAVVLEVFSVAGGGALAGNATVLRATGWVLDDDGTGNKLAVFTSKPVLVEGNAGTRQANFEVSLSRPAPGPIDIVYQTKDVTGLAGSDYMATSGTLHFATGQTQASVAVPVIGDGTAETSDIFLLTFAKPAQVVQASLGEALVLDDDAGTPTVSITGTSNVEGTSGGDPNYLSFGITLSAPATTAVTVTYQLLSGSATAGSDAYAYFSGTQVTFAPGETSKTVAWRIDSDAIDEADEAVVMELTGVTGTARLADGVNATRATGWILDDDGTGNNLAMFAESAQIVEGVNGYNRDAAVVVRLSRPNDSAIDLAYQTVVGSASAGSDFTAGSGTLNFSALQTVAAVRVPVIGDAVNEADESFSVQFTPSAALASGSAGTVGTVTILDGDRLPPPARLSIEAGANAQLNEGGTLQRSVIVNDSEDNGSPGWSYSVNYGDGSAAVTGTTLTRNLDLSHRYADGNATHTVAVTMTDAAGETATDSFTVNVANVAPTVALSGAASVQAGQPYTLNLGAVTDPGTDTVSQYRINWGDGTPVQIVTSAGNVAHTYASAANRTISVALVDEDGQHQNPSTVAVNVTAPAASLSLEAGANAALPEGNLFTRTISFADGEDNGTPGWSYTVNYGDGSAAVTGTTLTRSLDLSHRYADGNANPTVAVTLTDAAGESVTDSFVVTVTNVAPTAPVGGSSTVTEGSAFTLNVGTISDPGADTRTGYSIDWGDGLVQNLSPAQWAAANGSFAHTFADGASGGTARTVTVRATDEDGTFTLGSHNLTVTNAAPTLTLGGAARLNEGSTYTLAIAGSDPAGANDTLSYSINWGDGSAVQTVTAAQLASASGNVTHVFTDDQDGPVNATARTIAVTVSDGEGGSASQNRIVTVDNVAPTIALSGASTVQAGQAYTLNLGAITDPGVDTVSQYLINWGDGTPVQTVTSAGNVAHTYAAVAGRTISVTLVDEDGSHANPTTVAVNVTAPTPTLSFDAGGNSTVAEGTLFTRTINFVDGQDNGAPGWSYSINYGDGTAAVTGTTTTPSLNLSHLYADGSINRTVTVTLTDVAGESVTDSFLVAVTNVAPTATVGGNATVAEGAVFTLNVGIVSDPGVDTRTGYSIDWGDGVVQNLSPAQWAAAAGTFTHTFADGASGGTARTVTVRATDEDGTFTLGSHNLTVSNAAPTVALGGAASLNEGGTYTLAIAGSDPAGANDTLSYSINWGDGSAVQTVTAAQLAAASGNVTHVFTDDQDGTVNTTPRTITVTASDGEGGSTTQTRVVQVNNVAPTIALSGAASVQAGQAYTLNLGAITDPGVDTVSQYLINWGDGTAMQTVTTPGNVAHTYAAVGARTVSVTLVDEDGSFANPTTVAVNVTAPTATLSFDAGANAALNEGSTFTRTINFSDGQDNGAAGWTYSINYGDGSAAVTGTTTTPSLNLSHLYADGDATRTVSVTVTDVAGESVTDSFTVAVANVAPTVTLGGAPSISEGGTYTLALAATDPAGANDTLSYSINWGDGSAVQTVTAAQLAAASGNVTHRFTDDQDGTVNTTPRTITVTASDGEGGSTTQTRVVQVSNVAPTIALSGAASVQAGQAYTLNLGAITDPGTDTVSQYLINWGDGTPAQVVTSAGNVAHTYAAVANRTISVTLVDEDGSHANPTTVAVNVTAPTPTLSLEAGANASVAEGSLFTRTINFSDGQDNGAAGWSYSINYGDGTAAVTGTTTTPSLNLSHRYADGGATRNVSVTLTDVAGESVTDGFTVAVANVAPTIAFTGPATAQANQAYTLNLGAVTDPGQDMPNAYRIDWGDGSTPTQVTTRGDVQHVYATAGQYSVQVTVVDEDGSFTSPNTLRVDVAGSQNTRTVTVGDAVVNQRITGQWAQAWADADIAISHTANASAAQVAWSAVRFDASLPTLLSGGDISSGDLGVSGQSVASSTVRQEIDGLEALRFAVDGSATSVHLSLSRLFARDDGTAFNEAGRVRLYDAAGALVDERLFQGTNAQGQLTLDIDAAQAFSSVELSAGAMVNGQFQYGAYAGRAAFTDAAGTHGSDFLVDWAEFELIVVGQPAQPA